MPQVPMFEVPLSARKIAEDAAWWASLALLEWKPEDFGTGVETLERWACEDEADREEVSALESLVLAWEGA